jgi:hypothetical protein
MPHEEIAFVTPNGEVKVFKDTEELASFIFSKSKRSFFKSFLSSQWAPIIFVSILISIIVYFGLSSPEGRIAALGVLGSIANSVAESVFRATQARELTFRQRRIEN